MSKATLTLSKKKSRRKTSKKNFLTAPWLNINIYDTNISAYIDAWIERFGEAMRTKFPHKKRRPNKGLLRRDS